MKKVYDVCLAWNWDYEADFANFLDIACRTHDLLLLQVTLSNLKDIINGLDNHQISFQVLYDRASDSDEDFLPLVQWAQNHQVVCLNPYEQARKTWDKVAMHQALIAARLYTPYTITLPTYNALPDLSPIDLSVLGERFVIKPAHGGGGEGVITENTSWNRVLLARKEFADDEYLLQTYITPIKLNSRQAWFRVIYCTGKIYPCWWDTHTHVYSPVTPEEEVVFHLAPLHQITNSIAHLCKLDLFSTEIAITSEGHFVIVDYVNDLIDLRLKSKASDGVPNEIVQDIAVRIATVRKE